MQCPECSSDADVLDTRPTTIGRRRRYRCMNEHRFTTYESVMTPTSSIAAIASKLEQVGFTRQKIAEIVGLPTEVVERSIRIWRNQE